MIWWQEPIFSILKNLDGTVNWARSDNAQLSRTREHCTARCLDDPGETFAKTPKIKQPQPKDNRLPNSLLFERGDLGDFSGAG